MGAKYEYEYVCNIICRRLHFRHAISSCLPSPPLSLSVPLRSWSAYRAFNYVLRFGGPIRIGRCHCRHADVNKYQTDQGGRRWAQWSVVGKPSDIYLSHCTFAQRLKQLKLGSQVTSWSRRGNGNEELGTGFLCSMHDISCAARVACSLLPSACLQNYFNYAFAFWADSRRTRLDFHSPAYVTNRQNHGQTRERPDAIHEF